jgi:hypothetical protein
MIQLGQAKPLQLFLPFMYDIKSNETLFDKVSAGKMKLLLADFIIIIWDKFEEIIFYGLGICSCD